MMTTTIPSLDLAIGALQVVADSSAQLDLDEFREIAAGMQAMRDQLVALNERLQLSGRAPTPNDFASVMKLLAFTGREPPKADSDSGPRRYVVASRSDFLDRKQFDEYIHVSDETRELTIQWLVSTGAPMLTIHGDAWSVFQDWNMLFTSLAQLRQDDDRPTPGEVEAVLIAHGFTERR
jgi:hypothetical protein